MYRSCTYVFTRVGTACQGSLCGRVNLCSTSRRYSTTVEVEDTASKRLGGSQQWNSGGQEDPQHKTNEPIFGGGHPFKQLFPWKSKKEFVETLLQSVVLSSDGLLVINKPLGVGVLNFPGKDRPEGTVLDRIHTRGIGSTQYTMQDAVPLLRKALDEPDLVLVKSCEKMSSGLSVFATNNKSAEKFQEKLHLSRSITQENPVYRYHVITTHSPHSGKTSFRERVGIRMKSSPLSDIRQPVIEREFSISAVKKQEVVPIRVYTEVLGKGLHNTALLEIQTSNLKYHFLRTYCADLVVPILGDHLFSCRVRSVMGVPTKIDPSHALPNSADQELSMPLLKTLNLKTPEDSIIVPPHIHLHAYTVMNYFGKGKHLKLEAPYQTYFQWTCDQLHFISMK